MKKNLGIKIDTKLSFENHISSLCKTASQKLNALARTANYMDLSERKWLMKAFVTSQFSYCPLIWIFHCHPSGRLYSSAHIRNSK